MTGGTKAIAIGIPVIIALAGVTGCFQSKEPVHATALNEKPAIAEMTAIVSTHKSAPVDEKPAGIEKPVTADEASAVPEAVPVPLDLTKHYAMHASTFDKPRRFPWKMVPRGAQTFANVPLKIDGTIFLWGENNSKMGLNYPEKIAGIDVKQEFETLYVYHTAFFEGEKGSPVFDLVFQYQDGTSATDTIRSGEDVREWYGTSDETVIGPSGTRSVLAWNDDVQWNDQKQPLRFCLTAIANPHPKLEVTSIDLISSKTQTAGCIMAMTPGRARLMPRTNESE